MVFERFPAKFFRQRTLVVPYAKIASAYRFRYLIDSRTDDILFCARSIHKSQLSDEGRRSGDIIAQINIGQDEPNHYATPKSILQTSDEGSICVGTWDQTYQANSSQ